MTEQEALDEAAKAVGWLHWDDARQLAERGEIEVIRAHAKTIMENAALKAENEIERNLRQQVKDNGCVVSGGGVSMVPTDMWLDTQVGMERLRAFEAENERLRHAVGVAIRALEEVGYRHKGYTLTTLTTALERIDHD